MGNATLFLKYLFWFCVQTKVVFKCSKKLWFSLDIFPLMNSSLIYQKLCQIPYMYKKVDWLTNAADPFRKKNIAYIFSRANKQIGGHFLSLMSPIPKALPGNIRVLYPILKPQFLESLRHIFQLNLYMWLCILQQINLKLFKCPFGIH